jgi:hypothetical protein
VFLGYAVEVGALAAERAAELHGLDWDALLTWAVVQADELAAADPVERLLALLADGLRAADKEGREGAADAPRAGQGVQCRCMVPEAPRAVPQAGASTLGAGIVRSARS